MQRRAFLQATAVAGGTFLVTGATAVGLEETRIHKDRRAGHAVGADRPHGIGSTGLYYRVPTRAPVIALTFDDGPSAEYTGRILQILQRKQAAATFFVMGRNAVRQPDLLRQVASRHEIGNHTWDHHDLSTASAARARRELGRTHEAIHRITGVVPTLFRPPYGRFSGATAMEAVGFGYSIVLWSTLFDRKATAAQNASRLGSACGRGWIVLGHDAGPSAGDFVVNALPGLIDRWRAAGLRLVTVSELIAAGATRPVSGQGPRRTP